MFTFLLFSEKYIILIKELISVSIDCRNMFIKQGTLGMLSNLNFSQKFTKFYLLLLTFLLPLKFSGLAIMPETSNYFPPLLWEYLIVNFPNNSFGFFSGIGLVMTLLAFPVTLKTYDKNNSVIPFLWIGLLLASLFGIINATTLDYVYLSLSHIGGVVAYLLSMYILIKFSPKVIEHILAILAIVSVWTIAVGVYQYFWGFDEQIEFYNSQKNNSTMLLDIANKIKERRIFSTYGSCNAYAGFLLLVFGLTFNKLNYFSQMFEPKKLSQKIFLGIFLVSFCFVIYHTGSRAVIAGVATGGLMMIFLSRLKAKFKISLAVVLAVVGVLGILASKFSGRNFASFAERLGYIRSSLIMMYNNFFLGSGWGDFFVDNQKYRVILADEAARDPHNLFLTFGSQAGILALILVMLCYLYPLYRLIVKYLKNEHDFATGVMIFSLTAFLAHSMLDINYQIPSTFALSAVIFMIVAYRPSNLTNMNIIKVVPRVLLFSLLLVIGLCNIVLAAYNTYGDKKMDNFLTVMQDLQHKYTLSDAQIAYAEVEQVRPHSPFHKVQMYQYLMRKNFNQNPLMLRETVLPYLLKAIEKSPERSGYYFSLSNYYKLVDKNPDLSKKYLDIAIELAPYKESTLTN